MIALLCWLLIPLVNAFIDAWIIERLKQPIDHLIEYIFRGMVAILYGALIFDAQDGPQGMYVLLYEISSFDLVFELALNLLRRKPWNYLGNTAALDRFLSKRRPIYYLLKLISAAGAVLAGAYLLHYGR